MNSGGVVFLLILFVTIVAWSYNEPETKVTPIKMQTIEAACVGQGGWDSFNPTVHTIRRAGKKTRTIDVTCRNGNLVRTDLNPVNTTKD